MALLLGSPGMTETTSTTDSGEFDPFYGTGCISDSFLETIPADHAIPPMASPQTALADSLKSPGFTSRPQQSPPAWEEPRAVLNAPSSAEDDSVTQLLDLQARLAKLAMFLRGGSGGHDAIEDAFRAGETMVSLLDGFGISALMAPVLPDSIIVLLLSSCHASLIHSYELIVDMLRGELHEDKQHQQASKVMSMPAVSVGTVRVAMPPRAVAEIHLHLVTQMVHRLRLSLQECASRIAASKISTCTVHHGFEVLCQCHLARTCCDNLSSNTLMGVVWPALREAGQREDMLVSRVRTLAFTLHTL